MIEIPKGLIAQFRSGGHGPSVQCKNCGFGVAIGGNHSKLPERGNKNLPVWRNSNPGGSS
jgi:hypothetical protein